MMTIVILIAKTCLVFSTIVLALFAIHHCFFALYRLSLRRPRDLTALSGFVMPSVSVLVPMHNEEKVVADVLQALVNCDYDWDRLEILAINDRSEDRTGEILDEFASRYPIVKALHRTSGQGGKGAALQFATAQAKGEILLLFDADYFPGRSLLKLLVAPFCDPQVGAVMGRVVPHNPGASLLAGLLDLERGAGYQIGQQARFNLGLTPQFGGTVGGVRASALRAVGGWNSHSLTEDTDLTFQLLLHGWKVTYVNRAECYEEVPQAWPVRRRQIIRWATGHTECMHRYWRQVLKSEFLTLAEKADSLFVLACYWTAPVMVLGWVASLVLFLSPEAHVVPALSVALTLVGYQLFGSQASFLELGSAALLDGKAHRVLLMPLSLVNFFASTGTICGALLRYYVGRFFGSGPLKWHKTARYRGTNGENGDLFRGNGKAGRPDRSANGLYFFSSEAPLP